MFRDFQLTSLQGMHELLAPILWIVDLDSVSSEDATHFNDPIFESTLSLPHVLHDTFSLFSVLMKNGAKEWYDFSNSVSVQSQSGGFIPLSSAGFGIGTSGGKGERMVQPMVEKCIRIQEELLKKVDEECWGVLKKHEIEPVIWGM
jgi:hypothetical protein